METLVVTAAVVDREGRILIARRRDGHLAGYWEFPGGKVEPGEGLAECLARELGEELGIRVEVLEPLTPVEHAYPGKTVRLHAFYCRWLAGEPKANEHDQIAWVLPGELNAFPLAPADLPIAAEVLRGGRTL
ncbi:MAG: 8-oxo-dGTP diphosphatase MutT [Acidobacteriota bacterium]